MSKTRAALYIRVSTAQQTDDGQSLEAQELALRNYCKKNDYEVGGVYIDDGVSGTKLDERDELQRMLSDIKMRRIDIVLFTKLDRYFRSVRHYLNTQEVLDKYEVPWKAIWENYETQTPQGRLMVSQMLSFAQFEAENTATRIERVFDYKKTQREVLSGKVPYGYKIEDKHLVADPEKADIARQVFQYYIDNGSMCETIRRFESYGIPKSQRAMKWMLMNEKYIGHAYGYDDYCEPIIDKQTFETVQRMLKMNVRRGRIHDYVFSGLVYCKECGCKMAGTSDTYKDSKYFSYMCTGHYRPVKICKNTKLINEKKLERYLVENLETLAFSEVDERKKAKSDDLEWQIKVLEKKLARLKDLYVNELITIDEYRADMTDYKSRIDGFKKQLENYDYSDKVALKDLVGTNLADWYWTLTDKEKRTLWRKVIRRIDFGQDKSITVEFL